MHKEHLMSYENPRKNRLLREALGAEQRLPSVRGTCVTLATVAGSVALIVCAGFALPERFSTVPMGDLYQASALATVPDNPNFATDAPPPTTVAITRPAPVVAAGVSGWPAPDASATDGIVVDLTY